MAQESRGVDGRGRKPLGATQRQAPGHGIGVCDAVGVATGVCRDHRRAGTKTIWIMESLGASRSGGVEERIVGADAARSGNGGTASGGHSGPLAARFDDGLSGGTQQFVLGNQTQSPWLSLD